MSERSRHSSPETGVRRATSADIDALTRTLSRAFDQDPFYAWLLPQDERRSSAFTGIFQLFLRDMSNRLSDTYTTEAGDGVAVWQPPGAQHLSLLRQVQLLPRFARVLGWLNIPRSMRLLDHMDSLQSRFAPKPHFYLMLLGVEPTRHKTGLGRQLLLPGLANCSAQGIGSYVETANEANVPFYERQGFTLCHRADHPEFPTIFCLTRPA
jgi:ribosomal protein S18 acetylase RimI-like enzyme